MDAPRKPTPDPPESGSRTAPFGDEQDGPAWSDLGYRELLDAATIGLVQHSADGTIVSCNPVAERLLGLASDQILGRSPMDPNWQVIHDDGSTFPGEEHPATLVLRTGEDQHSVVMGVPRPDGGVRWLSVDAHTLGADHGAGGAMAAFRDVTPLIERHRELRERATELGKLAEHSSDLIARVSIDGTILSCSAASVGLLGRQPEALLGMTLGALAHPDDAPAVAHVLARLKRGPCSEALTFRVRHADGREVWCEGSFNRFGPDIPGSPPEVVIDVRDVNERKLVEHRLHHQTLHDALTGLPNRVLFNDRLRQALLRRTRGGGDVALLFVDLDHFKVVNDSLGHEAGDRALVAVGQRLRSVLRPGDSVARFGGDEFLILCEEGCTAAQAQDIAERVGAAIRGEPVLPAEGGRAVYMTASIGIALSGDRVAAGPQLLSNADAAMYDAKEHGRARHAMFSDAMHQAAVNRLVTENDLRIALDRGQLRLHYQPIVSLFSGEPAALEALVRWQHPVRGMVQPGDFIPVAEESDLIVRLGTWVLREATRQVGLWHTAGGPCAGLRIAVNVSAQQFSDPALTDIVLGALADAGLAPGSLILEITENVLMRHAGSAITTLDRLTEAGITVSIDDFGTGYSSLAYLTRFPIAQLKIDRTFTDHLNGTEDDDTIVTAVLALARALGIEAVAEGVETREQLDSLRRLGCDYVQGYFLARPTPPDDLERVLGLVSAAEPTQRPTR